MVSLSSETHSSVSNSIKSPVLNDLAWLRAAAKFQITPACDFRESILIPFFFLFCFVCMSKVILSVRFYFCLGFPVGRRTGSIALNRDKAKSTSSAGVLESLLNLFWWPFLPLFHCEKECLSVPGIRRLFWVIFFLLAVHLVATNGRKPISQPQKNRTSRHRPQRSAFPERTPFLPQARFEATPLCKQVVSKEKPSLALPLSCYLVILVNALIHNNSNNNIQQFKVDHWKS